MDGTIVVLDYSEFEREKVKYILSKIGDFNVIEITNVNQYYLIANKLGNISLIILDIAFPVEKEGFSILSSIRKTENIKDTPIIIITKSDELEYRTTALKYAVNDYIEKPYKATRLENSIRSMVLLENKFTYTVNESAKIILSFEEYFARELNMAKRMKQPLSLLLITLIKPKEEKFKEDENLPQLKERVYAAAIERVKQCLRTTDYAILNNADIIVVLPNTDLKGAKVVNDKINRQINIGLQAIGVKFDDFLFSTYVTYPEDGNNFQNLMERAFKRVNDKEMLEKLTNILDGTIGYANNRYKQFKKYTE